MARPRKSTGSKTSFGKRSEAEKSFRDKKKRSGRGDDERPRSKFTRSGDSESRPRPSGFGGSKPSFGRRNDDSSERPKRFSKPFEKREGGTDGPFRKKSSDSFQSRTGGGPSRFGKRPFQKREEGSGTERPFKKRESNSFDSRSDKPSRFTKKPFIKREDRGDEKPFRKRESTSFDSRSDRPSRFTKKPFTKREEGDEKPFKNNEDIEREYQKWTKKKKN